MSTMTRSTEESLYPPDPSDEAGGGVGILTISLDPTYLEGSDAIAGNTIDRTRQYAKVVRSYDVVVYAPRGTDRPRKAHEPNLRIHPARSPIKWLFPLSAYRVAAQVCRQQRLDIVHTQDVFAAGLVGYLLKRRFNLPLIFGFHGDVLDNPHWLRERPINRAYNRLGHWLLRHGDGFRVVSSTEREKLIGLGVPPDRIWWLRPLSDFGGFVDADGQGVRQRLLTQHGFSKIVVFAGRLVDQKDLPTLLKAMVSIRKALVDKVGLVIVGDGSRRHGLEEMSRSLGLGDSIVFAGRVDHDRVGEYMAAADVFALSSTYEGNAKVLVEAAACGLPVVATDISGTRDTVVDGETGIVVPPQDPEAMAQAIVRLLKDPDTARRMGEAARKYVLGKFTPDAQLVRFKEMWETTVQRHLASK